MIVLTQRRHLYMRDQLDRLKFPPKGLEGPIESLKGQQEGLRGQPDGLRGQQEGMRVHEEKDKETEKKKTQICPVWYNRSSVPSGPLLKRTTRD